MLAKIQFVLISLLFTSVLAFAPRHQIFTHSSRLEGRSRGGEEDGDCAVRNVGLVPQEKPILFGGEQTDEYMERYKTKIAIGHYIPAAFAAAALAPTILHALGK